MSSDRLRAEIEAAFPLHRLEGNMFGDTNGLWGVYADSEFEAGAYGRTWNTLDPAFVEEHGGALRYMSAEAFVAMIAAYLLALLRGTQNEMPALVLGQLTRREGFESEFDRRIAMMTEQQRGVISSVIRTLSETERYARLYREEIDAALETWNRLK